MKLEILKELNAERAARHPVIVITDTASGEQRLVKAKDIAADPLRAELDELLAGHEVDAFIGRCERLLVRRRMPAPSGEWRAIPWPAF